MAFDYGPPMKYSWRDFVGVVVLYAVLLLVVSIIGSMLN
jgi:hypothetical protein